MNRLGKCSQTYFVKALRKGDIHENLNLEELSGCLTVDEFHLIKHLSVSLNAGDVFALLDFSFFILVKETVKASRSHSIFFHTKIN